MKNMIRLPLTETFNVRDLGGYPINENAITKWGVFYRGGQVSSNSHDIDLIYKYGIRTVIDLLDEGTPYVSPVLNDKRFTYMRIPLVDHFDFPDGRMYPAILSLFSENVKKVFYYIYENLNHGGILFHCASGKDRTGVISALLLSLLNVSELDIIANFMVSEIYLRPYSKFINRPIETMPSPPSWIEEDFLEYIKNKYGDTNNYLKQIGIPNNILFDIYNAFYENLT